MTIYISVEINWFGFETEQSGKLSIDNDTIFKNVLKRPKSEWTSHHSFTEFVYYQKQRIIIKDVIKG